MQILLMGSFDFAKHIRKIGHEVFTCGPDSNADICLFEQDPEWAVVQKAAQKMGISFDAVLVSDNVGRRCLPTGIANCPAVTAFYGVDSPLNEFWQQPYARLFDIALFDQPEQAESLAKIHGDSHWLPLGIDPDIYDGQAPEIIRPGVAFVGVVNPKVRPKRSALLERVSSLAPLEIRGGRQDQWFSTNNAAQMYRSYQVVLNENLFPGLTTRPLEVMASGGCLLSEGPYSAMTEYFTEFEHLLYLTPDNLDQRIELALSDSALRTELVQNGKQAVLEGHTLRHRAKFIITHLQRLIDKPRQRPDEANAMHLEGEALMWAALRWPGKDGKRRLLRAAGRLRQACINGKMTPKALSTASTALVALGRSEQAMPLLLQAAESGGQIQNLQLAITAASIGREDIFRQVVGQWSNGLSGLSTGPGQACFHMAAAKLLLTQGADLTPGFNRSALPVQTWNSLEHILEAARIEPHIAQAWEMTGDILIKRGAPNEAHVMFARACALKSSKILQGKLRDAAKKGYLC